MEHKPIIHRKCGKRMPDRGEKVKDGKSLDQGDRVCTCWSGDSTVCSSRPQPPDLQFYDKYGK
jgi:hypothetical protein